MSEKLGPDPKLELNFDCLDEDDIDWDFIEAQREAMKHIDDDLPFINFQVQQVESDRLDL